MKHESLPVVRGATIKCEDILDGLSVCSAYSNQGVLI
jgi:hypothetical protein